MIICTSICTNYLPKAMVLAASVKRVNPARKFLLCLTEKELPDEAKSFPDFDHAVLAKDLGFPNPERYLIRYSIVEASTAVKGQIFRYLFKQFPEETKFVYLDPDIFVYSDLSELDALLDHEEIVLTPHLLTPGNLDMELSCMNHGIYNLGFLAVRRSVEAERFINWWCERLDFACYDDMGNGIFTDQKWIDLAPALFKAFILKNPGYNVATWNLLEREIENRQGTLHANGAPIRFIHFSGFDSNTFFWAVEQWVKNDKVLVKSLGEAYSRALQELGEARLRQTPWSYDTLDNGEKLDAVVRKRFRDHGFLKDAPVYQMTLRTIQKAYADGNGRWVKIRRKLSGTWKRLRRRFFQTRKLQSLREVNYNLEEIAQERDFIHFRGWAFFPGQSATGNEILLLLSPAGGEYLTIETTPVKRPDVSEYFVHWDLDDAGFTATLEKTRIREKFKDGQTLSITLLLKTKTGSVLQKTNHSVHV
ncbi:MAG: hypothetical protein HGA76_09840 [Candidatus Firestonebacteria bacterium]|nr:hypothetical protein [Candidatus Firestonebacteria bacterium]